jgi:hypothetical protein
MMLSVNSHVESCTYMTSPVIAIAKERGLVFLVQIYSEFFLRLAIGFYMLIFQPPVNFCSDKNIQTIFGTKLEDFLNYRIDYNLISQTVEKVVKKIFFRAPK